MLIPARIRLSVTKNRLLGEGLKKKVRFVFLAGVLLFIWVNMFVAMKTEVPPGDPGALTTRVRPYFLPLFTILFLGSLTAVSNLLFFAEDIQFLAVYPRSAGEIVLGKLLEAFLLEIQFILLLAVPMVLAAIVSLAIPASLLPMFFLCLTGTLVFAFGSGTFISLGLARLTPGHKGRMAVSLLASLLGVAAWIFMVRLGTMGGGSSSVEGVRDGVGLAGGGLTGFIPIYWGADAFTALGKGNPAAAVKLIAGQILLGGILLAGSAAAGRQILQTRGAMAFTEAPAGKSAETPGLSDFHSPRWTRDIKLAARTPQASTQLLTLTLIASLLPVLLPQAGGGVFAEGLMPFPAMSLALIAFLLLHSGLLLVPLEGAGGWIMKTSPRLPNRIFFRKIAIAAIPGLAAFLIAGILSRGVPPRPVEVVSFLLIAPALTSTGCHAGYRWGNFRWENYREILPQPARLILLPLSIAVGVLFAAAGALVPDSGLGFLPREPSVLLVWFLVSLTLVSVNIAFSVSLLRSRDF